MRLLRRARTANWAAVILASAVVGLVLRLGVLMSSLGGLDPDEAVVGLMALHALRGEFFVFYWGQPQSGTLESLLAAGAFLVSGVRWSGLKSVPILLYIPTSFLVWRLGLRSVGYRGAILGTSVFWVGSTAYIWWSTKVRGHYSTTLLLVTLLALMTLRIVQRETGQERSQNKNLTDTAIVGLALGVGWWTSPQIAFAAVPIGIWALWHLRSRMIRHWMAVPAALVGMLPWLGFNAARGWPSLHPPPGPEPASYPLQLWATLQDGLPQALGLKMPFVHDWLPPLIGPILYLAFAAGLVWAVCRRWAGWGILTSVLVGYPLILAASPYPYLGEPRYLYYMWPFASLAVGGLLAHFTSRTWLHGAALILIATMSVVGLTKMTERGHAIWWAPDIPVPRDLAPAARALESLEVDRVFAPYSLAYPLTFEAREQIIASPYDIVGRYKPYDLMVTASERPGYIFLEGSVLVGRFEAALRELGADPGCAASNGFVACGPSVKILPGEAGL
jgi:hypothetical protein